MDPEHLSNTFILVSQADVDNAIQKLKELKVELEAVQKACMHSHNFLVKTVFS
jgi:hypothetical protein